MRTEHKDQVLVVGRESSNATSVKMRCKILSLNHPVSDNVLGTHEPAGLSTDLSTVALGADVEAAAPYDMSAAHDRICRRASDSNRRPPWRP